MPEEPTVTELDQAIQLLSKRIADLEADNARLRGLLAPLVAAAAPPPNACPNGGSALLQQMHWDNCLVNPQPMDSSVIWTRRQPGNEAAPGYVRSILSLFSEGDGANSYPWPLFVQVRATPDSSATMPSANAFAVNGRLINPASGFGAAFFSDVQHSGGGTDIGFDFELIRYTKDGRTIGLNILNAGDPLNMADSDVDGDEAINIQTKVPGKGWNAAIRLEANAGSGRAGHRGIWIEGQYEIGLDMEGNNIKLNRGAKIFFDENRTLYLWLNPANTRLEFRYLDKVLGFLTLATPEHEL